MNQEYRLVSAAVPVPLDYPLISMKNPIAMSNLYPRSRQSLIFTSIDFSTVLMIDITGFSPGIGSPSAAFSITSSPFMTEGSASEDVEVRVPSAAGAGGTGERRRKVSLSRLIPRPNEKFDDPIQDTIYL